MAASNFTFKERLKTNANKITHIVNTNKLFGDHLMEVYSVETRTDIRIDFRIDKENSSSVDYFMDYKELKLEGRGKGVKSTIGNRTGSLLFNLQLLLMVLSNVVLFTLDNFTDDPARACTGIYELLDVNKGGVASVDYCASDWSYKSLQEKIVMSEGEMKLNIVNIHSDIKKKLKDIIDKRSIGNSDVFIRQIQQNWSQLGGHGLKQKQKKRKTNKRKTNKRKTNKRKINKRKTNKRKTNKRKR